MNEPRQASLSPGPKLGQGRFTLVRKLGAGGMGMVWLARDEKLRKDTALKFLPPEVQNDGDALESLRRETARAQLLSHPNIVRIHDFYELIGEPAFISMECVEGKTLHDLRRDQPNGVYAWEILQPLVAQLCDALEYAHEEGVIHRDLKPANILMDSKGRLKLADFGIAAVIQSTLNVVSVVNVRSGTLLYMSPQQLAGKKPTSADDIYALGVTLYHLLTSKPPFFQGDITDQVKNIPPAPFAERLAEFKIPATVPPPVEEVVMACLAKLPEQRPQTAMEVWERLSVAPKNHSATPAAPVEASAVTMASTRLEPSATSQPGQTALAATIANTPTAAASESGQTQQSSPPPSKAKTKSGLWLALAACLLLLGVAGAWYFLKYQPEQERQRQVTVQQVRDAAEKKRLADEAETQRLAAEKLQQEAEAKRVAEAKAQQEEAKRKEAERIAAARGGLIVDTKPTGATATLGGEHIEKTPATFKAVKLGKFPLKLLLSGYEEFQREVEIKENEFLDLGTLTLMRSTGQLEIRSQPEAMDWQLKSDTGEITERQGKTPSTLTNLPTGTYRVTLLRPGWPEYKGEAAIARNQATTVQHEFAQGGLIITSDPKGAEAELDGKSIGKTPVEAPAVPVGEHELTVRFPGLVAQKQTVKVAKDATATVDIKFPYGSVVVTSDPSRATVKQNGSTLGTTPLTLDLVAVGEVNYQVELSSYRSKTVQGTVQARQSMRLTAKLEKAGPQLGERWTNSLDMVFVPVPGTKVLFGIWDTRVKDYAAYARANRGVDTEWKNPGFEQGDDHPVVKVSWEDAKAFCAWLTKQDQDAGLLDRNQQYRLPTDEEWSVAVGLPRETGKTPKNKAGGIKDVYPWGTQWPPPRGVGNYDSSLNVDSFDNTSPVGSFTANRFDLFDMGGNVWQWCGDWYDSDQKYRVLRGGSWFDIFPGGLLSSYRNWFTPDIRDSNYGFRCVLEVGGAMQ